MITNSFPSNQTMGSVWRRTFMKSLTRLPIQVMLKNIPPDGEVLGEIPRVSLKEPGAYSFLLDTDRIAHEDLFTDTFGYWNTTKRKSTAKSWNVDVNGCRVSESARYIIKKKYAVHPNTQPPCCLVKASYVALEAASGSSHGYAVVSYLVRSPCEVIVVPHGNSKRQIGPYQRTRPSVLAEMKLKRRKESPRDVFNKMMCREGGALGEREENAFPRNMVQVYNMSRSRSSGSKPFGNGIRKTIKTEDGNVSVCASGNGIRKTEMYQYAQQKDSFVRMQTQPVVDLTRVETFSACHRLHQPSMSPSENREVFGKCNNPNGHGHNYTWQVTLRGPIDPITGMVYNLSDLKKEMATVLDMVDHKNLDLDVDSLKGKVTTTENLTVFLWNELKKHMKSPHLLYQTDVHETAKNIFSYRGT